MKCPNCGANLKNKVCEYCGYEDYEQEVINDSLEEAMDIFNDFMSEFDTESFHVTEKERIVRTSCENDIEDVEGFIKDVNEQINKHHERINAMMTQIKTNVKNGNVDISCNSIDNIENIEITVNCKKIDINIDDD